MHMHMRMRTDMDMHVHTLTGAYAYVYMHMRMRTFLGKHRPRDGCAARCEGRWCERRGLLLHPLFRHCLPTKVRMYVRMPPCACACVRLHVQAHAHVQRRL